MNTALVALIALAALLLIPVLVSAFLLRKSHVGAAKQDASIGTPRGTDDLGPGFQAAINALRAKVGGSDLEKRLPWVLLIGESDSGKTALLNDLDPAGASGPRDSGSLHWRFLDQGVVVEVAGDVLVTSDGKPPSDGRWSRVLKQLRRHRPDSPVNGITVVIPATRLFSDNEVDRAKRRLIASGFRAKLDELQREFGIVLPVHVVITKCDEIRGFGSFCWEIDSAQKEDIFGWSNPNTLESAFAPDWVDDAFDTIENQIERHQLRAFGSRPAGAEAEDLFVFPLAFDALRGPLRAFLTEIFRETAYVDSNFLRGIFFCGDCRIVRQSQLSLPATIGVVPPRGTLQLNEAVAKPVFGPLPSSQSPVQAHIIPAPPRRDIAFVGHLFALRIFSETRVARPVTRIRSARRRNLLTARVALAAFVLFFGITTGQAWHHLAELRDEKYLGLLDRFENDLSIRSAVKSPAPSVQIAYELMDTLGTVHANGFHSIFLPYSHIDRLDERLADTLAEAFGRIVFPAFSSALDQRAKDLLGSCSAAKMTGETPDEFAPALSSVAFTKDPEYVALGSFDRKYGDLETAIAHYDVVRRTGLGSFKDFDALFQYLVGRGLDNSDAIAKSYYYQHAVLTASGSPIPVTNDRYLETCSKQAATSLVNNFYASWFENNPLLASTEEVGEQLNNLESHKLQTNDALATLSTHIRELDGQISTGAMNWLTATSFDANSYPALNRLLALSFVDEDLRQEVAREGEKGLSALKNQLFSVGSELSGSVLTQHGTEVRLSGNVVVLEAGLQSLLHQEFTSEPDPAPSPSGTVIWNKAALMKAAQLPALYDKYAREQLPLLPPSFRSSIQQIAARNVNRTAAAEVNAAQEPQTSLDEATALMAIRSFNDAAPILLQLQAALPGGGVSTNTGFHFTLNTQGVALAKWLNTRLLQQPLYPFSVDVDRNDTGRPLSLQLFKVDSQDEIEQYLASQRDRIRSLALDYASPLASYLQSQGLQHAADFDRWSAIVRDVQAYEAKKPGNSIAALEGFIRGDLNKISLESGCQVSGSIARSNDYFVQLLSNIQNAAVQGCSQLALNVYSSQIAGFFNAKLTGRFPFGPVPSESGTAQADPYDVAEFLARIGKHGPALKQLFASDTRFAQELPFIDQCLALRDMLSATPPGQLPAADLSVFFRANQTAERGGNQIIDWSLGSGDLSVHYPGTQNSVRWHYGDSVRVSLRYAKDSPVIPRAGAADPNQQIDGRVVSWNYSGPWALFALLAQHGGQASNFGVNPELLPSILGFVIPVVPDVSRQKIPATAASQNPTSVFVRIALRVADGKQAREVPVVVPPMRAPVIPTLSAKV